MQRLRARRELVGAVARRQRRAAAAQPTSSAARCAARSPRRSSGARATAHSCATTSSSSSCGARRTPSSSMVTGRVRLDDGARRRRVARRHRRRHLRRLGQRVAARVHARPASSRARCRRRRRGARDWPRSRGARRPRRRSTGAHQRDVGQVRAAGVRIVDDGHVARRPSATRSSTARHRQRRRAEVHRDVRRLRHQPPLRVEQRARVVAPLLDVRRKRRPRQRHAHLLGHLRQAMVPDLELRRRGTRASSLTGSS